jgi:hypothetical protein
MLTQEQLKELLHYDLETGIFTWKVHRNHLANVGDVAGGPNKGGYIQIVVAGHKLYAHRLAWLYVHGEWPPYQIDHIDGRRDFNAIANLRLATNAENGQNIKGARSHNPLGLLGAHLHECGKYQARITVNRAQICLGVFTTPEEAHAAYVEAKRKYHKFGTL